MVALSAGCAGLHGDYDPPFQKNTLPPPADYKGGDGWHPADYDPDDLPLWAKIALFPGVLVFSIAKAVASQPGLHYP